MAKRATIKDVARLAGVSISTVSRVLNKTTYVDDQLKERVFDAAKAIGYTPNEIARSLKRSNSSIIAFIVSNTADPFFTFIARGIEEVTYLNGYSLISCSSSFSVERENYLLNSLCQRRVDGIIINTIGKNDEEISRMSQNVPVVLSNRMITSPTFVGDFVDFDNMSGVKRLTEHLVNLGHRRIALINGPQFVSTAKERQLGFCAELSSIGVDMDNYPYLFNSEETFTMQDGFNLTERALSMTPRPTAIVAANSEMALGALRYCREKGIRVPEDLSLCSFGNILHQELMYVNVTHVHTDLMTIGNRMGELLLDRIDNRDTPIMNREVRFDVPLTLGNSTAPPSDAY